MPATLTYPGVYIEEIPSGVHTITGVATSIAAFVGWASQGPVDEAVLVQSFLEYEALYGGLNSASPLGYAVNQFFANGGQQAYIARIGWDGSLPAAPGTAPLPYSSAYAAGVGAASAMITARAGSVSASAVLTAGTPVLQGVSITPSQPAPIPSGLTQLFTATWTNSDGSSTPPASIKWSSSNTLVATVNSTTGLVTAVAPGACVITVRSGIVSESLLFTVSAVPLSGLAVTPVGTVANPVIVGINQQQQFRAVAQYADGSSQDVTESATWAMDPNLAAHASLSSIGLLQGSSAGSGTVTATFGGGSGQKQSQNVTIQAAVLSVAVLPASPVAILPAGPVAFSLQTAFSDNTFSTLAGVSWNSSNPGVATIDSSGSATPVAAGVAIINATVTIASTGQTFSASTTLTVKPSTVTLSSISISPATSSVASGNTQQLTAMASYSDNTVANVTGIVTWAFTPAAGEPTFKNPLSPGLATGNSQGSFSVQANIGAVKSGAVTLNVTAPVPVSVAVLPLTAAVPNGLTQTFTATVTFSDGTTGSTASWSSSATNVATVSPTTGVATAVASGGTLTLFAANPGAWGNNIQVSVQSGKSGRFGLQVSQVQSNGSVKVVESYVNLSITSTDPQYVVSVIDNDSSFITFIDPATGAPVAPAGVPMATSSPISLTGGSDGTVLVPASDGNFEVELNADGSAGAGGVHLLDRVDIFNLLCVPAETDSPTISSLQEYCHTERAFYIVDPPQNTTTSHLESSGPIGSTPGSITGQYSINSAYYFPWIQAPDPLLGNRVRLFPPCGVVAGIYAATDTARGVWKAPAGIDAGLTGTAGLQYVLTDLENGTLNIQAINCLRNFKVYGDVVWGARTLQGNDQAGSEWKYVPIRRLALFLESSLYDGTQWAVFEPNDETLWSQIRLNVGAFMQGLFQQGAFAGSTPQKAYFVKCDAENNPDSSVALGVVNILVGFAPLYPAEFVVIQIEQIAGQTSN
jgi:phage tail sheath protein FI